MNTRPLAPLLALALAGCAHAPASNGTQVKLDAVPRADFNRIAADLALPLFWTSDVNGNGALDPAELAVFGGLDPKAKLTDFVQGGQFTSAFQADFARIARWKAQGQPLPQGLDAAEKTRRALSVQELEGSRPSLVITDLRGLSAGEKAFAQAILDAGQVVERLYAKQLGVWDLRNQVPADDTASQMVFYRNHGFHCVAPKTQGNPACSAIPHPPKGKVSGLYPNGPLQQPGFCAEVGKDKVLGSPFTVVRQDSEGKLVAVPYIVAFKDDMAKVSALLTQAANALPAGEEAPLRAYLRADAQAFLTNDWVPADEAWAKMNAENSKWYLRVAPDETYAEPCSTKALFQVSFGRINQGSLRWQQMLTPLQNQMEQAVAGLAGPPYAARKVSFHLPDFFDVALNAGDSRAPTGATVGESLPNFGPVANQGRGRTVAMTNFYTDPDSLAALRKNAEALLCPAALARFTPSTEPELLSTILHEATHNLGPSAQYKVNGQIDNAVFGGPLASTLEELKAQSGALYFIDWLAQEKRVARTLAEQAHVSDLLWSFGHISRGMFDSEKHPHTYSQLAAMQLGFLMRAGAVRWDSGAMAANGADRGCFNVDFSKFQAADTALLAQIAGIKARGDKASAERWLAQDVTTADPARTSMRDTITQRMLRTPKATFVYDVLLR